LIKVWGICGWSIWSFRCIDISWLWICSFIANIKQDKEWINHAIGHYIEWYQTIEISGNIEMKYNKDVVIHPWKLIFDWERDGI